MSEKRKTHDGRDDVKMPRVSDEIQNLMVAENIDRLQKSLIFSQMVSYKKQYLELRRRMNEMIDAIHPMKCADNVGDEADGVIDVGTKENISVDNASIKKIVARCNDELISKETKIAELEKKLEHYQLSTGLSSTQQPDNSGIREVVEKILSENMVSKSLASECMELRKKMENTSREAEKKIMSYVDQNNAMGEENRALREKLELIEQEHASWINEAALERSKYKSLIYAQRKEHVSIEDELEAELRHTRDEARYFRTRCMKLDDEINFLVQKLERMAEKYEILRKQLEKITETKQRIGNVTDYNLLEELENLSRSYDKLVEECKDVHSKYDKLTQRLDEAERKSQQLAGEMKRHVCEPAPGHKAGKVPERCTFDARLFEYEELRDDYEDKKRLLAQYKNSYIEVSGENEGLKEKTAALEKECAEHATEVGLLNAKLAEATFELGLLTHDRKNLLAVIDSFAEGRSCEFFNDIDKYKKLLKCMACDKRYKDTVINKCMHVFCEECLDQRIKSRNRMCPSCGESFSPNDVKRIYL
jgi:E3 ubiquitin-protein ligase BRE1